MGKADNKWTMESMPKGPYVLIPQNDMNKFKKDPWHYPVKPLDQFKTELGYATYCVGPDLEPLMVAHWYDTSD